MEKLADINLKIKEMAQRIRELREIQGFSVDTMAKSTGISSAEYMKCENGESDLNFAFIYRCASALGVNVTDIIEEKEATDAQKLIKEINTGLYVVDNKILFETLKLINNNNNKGEYYLTDIVNIISKNNPVGAYCAEYDYRLMGINDVKTLELVESLAKQKDFN